MQPINQTLTPELIQKLATAVSEWAEKTYSADDDYSRDLPEIMEVINKVLQSVATSEEIFEGNKPMFQRFMKIPVVVEAFRITPYTLVDRSNWPLWLREAYLKPLKAVGAVVSHGDEYLTINTLEGVMRVDVNDWIIKGVKDELYPCKPDIFSMTYAAVEDAEIESVQAASAKDCKLDIVELTQSLLTPEICAQLGMSDMSQELEEEDAGDQIATCHMIEGKLAFCTYREEKKHKQAPALFIEPLDSDNPRYDETDDFISEVMYGMTVENPTVEKLIAAGVLMGHVFDLSKLR